MSRSTIERLVGEVLRIAETEENKARLRRWETSLIAPQAARELTAVTVLSGNVSLSGMVTDLGGRPIHGARVRAASHPLGFQDVGTDADAEKFLAAVKEHKAQIVAMSALLTTTMPQMPEVIKALKASGVAVKTMVGGAPVTQSFADEIGADGYAPDAASAVDVVKSLLGAA